jgi:hypothetical protein
VVQALAAAALQGSPAEAKLPAADGRDLSARNREPRDDAAQQNWLESSIRQLAFAHNRLVDIVAPATPRTILFLQTSAQQAGPWGFLGKVPFVRRVMYAAILFLLGFILIRISPAVNLVSPDGNAMEASGWPLLLQELFLIATAGLGASFAVLFEVNRHTLQAAFDPIYEPFYWTRFALGLIAGVMLAELVPTDTSKPIYHGVAKPTLALLGGFSASVVYRVLVHLRHTIESLIPSEAGEELDAPQRASKGTHLKPPPQDRLNLAASLISLQQRLATNMTPEQLNREIDRILAELIVSGSGEK